MKKATVNKACVAYFAGVLIALASDDDRFENEFISTDLGGSAVTMERGLESLFVDDTLVDTRENKSEAVWLAAHEAFCEIVESDELLAASIEAFDRRAGEESQWSGKGMRPLQRHMIRIARKVLADLYKDAQLPTQPSAA